MRALLLAAGYGTRLLPLTETLPKCLMPVRGMPLLGWWLCALHRAGVEAVLVNLHHHAALVRAYLVGHPLRAWADTVDEPQLLGTAGTLLRNRAFFAGGPAMLVHADNLCLCDLGAFVAAHRSRPAGTEITMMTFETATPESCGIVELDRHGVVYAFHEKVAHPPGRLANGAVYIVEPGVLEFLAALGTERIDFSLEVLPHYLGRIYTFHNGVYHRDIGTPENLLRAQTDDLGDHPCAPRLPGPTDLDRLRRQIEALAAQLRRPPAGATPPTPAIH